MWITHLTYAVAAALSVAGIDDVRADRPAPTQGDREAISDRGGGRGEFRVWGNDKYKNIVRAQSPDAQSQPVGSIRIALAQGEFRDQAFMIGPSANDLSLNLRVIRPRNLPRNFLQTLETVYLRNRVDGDTETGEALRPLRGSLRVPKGESRQVYLRADTRNHVVKPGVYPFRVEIREAATQTLQTIDGRVEVWNFALPSHDVLPNNCYAQFEDSGFKDGKRLAQAVRDMKAFGFNVVFIHGKETPRPIEVDTKGKVLAFDDSVFLARMKPILKAWAKAPGRERLQFIITLCGIYAWNLVKFGITGTGLWTYCAKPYADRTCVLLYNLDGELLHSRRYEMYREGLDDYRYVCALREAASRKGPAAAKQAESLIQEAVAEITTQVQDPTAADRWRTRIADEICKLTA